MIKEKYSPEIEKNYPHYVELFKTNKIILQDEIDLNLLLVDKSKWKEYNVPMECSSCKLTLKVTFTDKDNRLSYRLLIFAKDYFFKEAIIRFDPDGSSHRNRHETLKKGSVSTPHFHCYNEAGIEYAYKTDFLNSNSPEINELVQDVNKGSKCFCDESNSRTSQKNYPFFVINRQQQIFDQEIDPHYGVF